MSTNELRKLKREIDDLCNRRMPGHPAAYWEQEAVVLLQRLLEIIEREVQTDK